MLRKHLSGRFSESISTVLIALLLAVVIWVIAVYQSDPPREGMFLESIPIEVLNAPTDLVVTSQPDDEVRVRIRAFSSSWASLTARNFRATADWSGLGEGTHSVPIRITCSDGTVTIVSSQPETLLVELERLQRETLPVVVELEDTEDVPLGYIVGSPRVEPAEAMIEGRASVIARVAAVTAPVSLLGQRDVIEHTVELRAVDENGHPLIDVRVLPSTATVHLDVERQLNYREVAVRARIRGHPARGYFVSSFEVEPSTVTVVGPPTAIAELPGLVSVKGEVDVTGATRMLAERMELDLPADISVLADGEGSGQTVLVTVGIDPVVGGTTVELPLQMRRLSEGLSASLAVPAVDVILTGPAVLLDDLEIDLLDAHVDLSGLGLGSHQVKTLVDLRLDRNPYLADLAVTSISPAYVEVTIREAPTPTPEPTPQLTPTPRARAQ